MRSNLIIAIFILFVVSLILNSFYSIAGYNSLCGANIACTCGDNLNASRILTASDTLTGCHNNTILNITSDNIELDCAGNAIVGNYSGAGLTSNNQIAQYTAIALSNPSPRINITIKNCIIEGVGIGVNTHGSAYNFTFINDNTFYNFTCSACSNPSGSNGIKFAPSNGNFFENVTIIQNNIFNTTSIPNKYSIGIELNFGGFTVDLNNVTIKDNIIDNTYIGIMLINVGNTSLINNTLRNMIFAGIDLEGIGDNSFPNNQKRITIANNDIFNVTYGFYFGFVRDILGSVTPGLNYTLRDNIIRNSSVGIQLEETARVHLLNNTFGNNTIDINSTGIITYNTMTYENDFAILIWNQTNLTIYEDLTLGAADNILILNNSVFLNSTKYQNLNKTINFTFFQQSFTANNRYTIYKDGTSCPSTICTKLASNPVSINVYGFSNYTIFADTFIPTGISLTSSAGTSFTRSSSTTISCTYSDDNPSTVSVTSSDGTAICSSNSNSCSASYTPTTAETKTITCTATDASSNINTATLSIIVNQETSGTSSSTGSSGSTTGTNTGTSPDSSQTSTPNQPETQSQPIESIGNLIDAVTNLINIEVPANNDVVSEVIIGEEAIEQIPQIEEQEITVPEESVQVEGTIVAIVNTEAGNNFVLRRGEGRDKDALGISFKTSRNENFNIKFLKDKENGIEKPRLDIGFGSFSKIKSQINKIDYPSPVSTPIVGTFILLFAMMLMFSVRKSRYYKSK